MKSLIETLHRGACFLRSLTVAVFWSSIGIGELLFSQPNFGHDAEWPFCYFLFSFVI